MYIIFGCLFWVSLGLWIIRYFRNQNYENPQKIFWWSLYTIIVSQLDLSFILTFPLTLIGIYMIVKLLIKEYNEYDENIKIDESKKTIKKVYSSVTLSELMNKEELIKVIFKEVRKPLKSPASAVLCDEEDLVIKNYEDEYIIEGYVSSHNSYAALIKNDFTIKLKLADGKWIVLSGDVGSKTQANNTLTFIINFILLSLLVWGIAFIWMQFL